MKKILTLAFAAMFIFCSYASARVQYDSTGRNVVYDGSIRGQRREAAQRAQVRNQQRIRGAAAAKINYGDNSSTQSKRNVYKTFKPVPNYYYEVK